MIDDFLERWKRLSADLTRDVRDIDLDFHIVTPFEDFQRMVLNRAIAVGLRVLPQFIVLGDVFAAIEAQILATPFERYYGRVVEQDLKVSPSAHR